MPGMQVPLEQRRNGVYCPALLPFVVLLFCWNPPQPAAQVAYRLHYAQGARAYTLDAGAATSQSVTLGQGVWALTVTAVGAQGTESAPSNTVTVDVVADSQPYVLLTGSAQGTVTLMQSPDLRGWTPVTTVTSAGEINFVVPIGKSRGFFQIKGP